MESSKLPLRNRLTHLFRPCNSSSTTATATATTSSSSGSIFTTSNTNTGSARTDIALDPLFVPHDSLFVNIRNIDTANCRTLSLSSSSRMLHSLDCSSFCRSRDIKPSAVTKKKERGLRESGEFYETRGREGNACPPSSPFNEEEEGEGKQNKQHQKKKKEKKKKKKKLFTNAYGFSTSSESEFFDSDEEETETFFTSRSFSSDSSEFYKRPSRNKKAPARNKINKKKKKKSRRSKNKNYCKGFRPIVSVLVSSEGEEKEKSNGVPVIKRSSDPYVDFRDSMVEMIVERQIFGAKDLEKLLHCYLSLNSPDHHCVILGAFADVSQVVFGC